MTGGHRLTLCQIQAGLCNLPELSSLCALSPQDGVQGALPPTCVCAPEGSRGFRRHPTPPCAASHPGRAVPAAAPLGEQGNRKTRALPPVEACGAVGGGGSDVSGSRSSWPRHSDTNHETSGRMRPACSLHSAVSLQSDKGGLVLKH